MKTILFNSEMVRAILDGRKTQTRRVVRHNVGTVLSSPFKAKHPEVPDAQVIEKLCMPPCQLGDIFYVRETWMNPCEESCRNDTECDGCIYGKGYRYKADYRIDDSIEKWHPSIHMPKEAARIWLRVTDVRVERLQEITPEQAVKEGVGDLYYQDIAYSGKNYGTTVDDEYGIAKEQFAWLWDSTIKKSDLDRYGWVADPWVWVIEFERIEKPS